MATDPMKVLDGRTLEGGGQLLRLALCLSALTSIPVRIHSIRGNRSGGGGLKAQHLACVSWLAHACRARVEGAEKGCKELLFVPAKAGELSPAFTKRKVTGSDGEKGEVYEARLDIKTAGSTGLALQAILPFILFTDFPSPLPVQLTISGGTNVSQSPSYEYITRVLLPTLETIGFPRIEAKLGKRGWSHGGSSIGNFTLEIPHRSSIDFPAFNLEPPPQFSDDKGSSPPKLQIIHLHAIFIAPAQCHDHFHTTLKANIKSHFPQPAHPSFTETHGNLTIDVEDSRHSKRMYFLLVATCSHSPSPPLSPPPSTADNTTPAAKPFRLGRDWLYDRKLPQHPDRISHNPAVGTLLHTVCADLSCEIGSGACVDEHMRDQLVVFQALAQGRSVISSGEGREASLHARTAEWVAQQMLGRGDAGEGGGEKGVQFDGKGGCTGVGFGARSGGEDGTSSLGAEMARLELGKGHGHRMS